MYFWYSELYNNQGVLWKEFNRDIDLKYININ